MLNERFQLTEEEAIFVYNKFCLLSKKQVLKVIIITSAIATTIFLAVTYYLMITGANKKAFLLVLLPIILIPSLGISGLKKAFVNNLKQNPRALDYMNIHLEEDDLVVKVDNEIDHEGIRRLESKKIKIKDILKIENDEKFLYIYSNDKSLFQVIPMRYINDNNKKEFMKLKNFK